jgi:hypothetical protein
MEYPNGRSSVSIPVSTWPFLPPQLTVWLSLTLHLPEIFLRDFVLRVASSSLTDSGGGTTPFNTISLAGSSFPYSDLFATNHVFPKSPPFTVHCPRATTASRLVTDTPMSPKILSLVGKLNRGNGDEGCRQNVEFGRCQRCRTGARGLQVGIGGLRVELRTDYGW